MLSGAANATRGIRGRRVTWSTHATVWTAGLMGPASKVRAIVATATLAIIVKPEDQLSVVRPVKGVNPAASAASAVVVGIAVTV